MDASEHAEFTAFARDRWRDLVRAAVFLGADPVEAEELAQRTLVRCHVAWDRVSSARNRDAYVYRILVNQLRDARRSRWWRLRSAVVPEAAVGDASDRIARADAVQRALAALTPGQRDVVVLRYFVQLSEAQTAQALGVAAGTVKSRLSRALERLAASDHLAEYAQERS